MSCNIIYALIDPNTKEMRYVGKTNNIKRRLNLHYTSSRLKAKTHKNNWLKSLIMNNQKAEIIILEEYDTYQELYQAEIDLIAYYKYIGCDLCNGTEGGDGLTKGFKHSEETKRKISETEKGRIFSEETKVKISTALTGKKLSEDTKQKLSIINLGKTLSDEHKNKISASNIGKSHGPSGRKGKKLLMINGKRTYI